MTTTKEEVRSQLDNLPDDCSLENVPTSLWPKRSNATCGVLPRKVR